MPRGGRRPGAGAPKGNFNAVTTGNNSARLLMVYLRMVRAMAFPDDPRSIIDREHLKVWLVEGGFFVPPHYRFNGDTRGALRFLWKKWFDSSPAEQSKAIKDLPPHRSPRPSERLRQIQIELEQRRLIRRAKKVLKIK
jgi:hypothetical protein